MKKLCKKTNKCQQHSSCTIVASPVGYLKVQVTDGAISKIVFAGPEITAKNQNITVVGSSSDPLFSFFRAELTEYFSNAKKQFSVPYVLFGTSLQIKIWQRIAKIPSGSTETYGSLAQELATSPRVIGNACRKNPVPLIIPCHRVVAANGLGGYGGKLDGYLCEIKSILLRHEKNDCDNQRHKK